MEITTWAQEYLQKTLSVNTIHRAIRRCRLKLYRSKKKPYLNMIQKHRRRPKTVEQLEACIRQEWDNIPIPKLEQLVSSVPRRLQTVIKRRGDATQW